MKRLVASGLLLTLGIIVSAQSFSNEFNKVYQACLNLRAASITGSTSLMKCAGSELKNANTRDFSTLKCLDDVKLSLNGHFIFDDEFVDSLVINKCVYSFAQGYADRWAKRSAERGASTTGTIFMKTCCISALSSSRYAFVAQGHQELAVIAEGDGLINLRIYDNTNKIWYNDDQDLNTGMPTRTRVFDIPRGNCLLEIEIINKTDKDISFVILSN